jgi:hypothetical protein
MFFNVFASNAITTARFNMTAVILSDTVFSTDPAAHMQNPDTGEIIRTWRADTDPNATGVQKRKIYCTAFPIISKTARGAGTAEVITPQGALLTTDTVLMKFDRSIILSKIDRVTDITDSEGNVMWKEEEDTGLPTVFEVNGVSPVPGPFGTHIEYHAILHRAEVQDYNKDMGL